MKRRGPGRPRLPKAERKAAIFSVRLSAAERDQIEQAARATSQARNQKLTAAAWAREILLVASKNTARR